MTSTAKETARLIPVELTIEEIRLERTFDKTIKSPSTYALPSISSSIKVSSISNSLAISST